MAEPEGGFVMIVDFFLVVPSFFFQPVQRGLYLYDIFFRFFQLLCQIGDSLPMFDHPFFDLLHLSFPRKKTMGMVSEFSAAYDTAFVYNISFPGNQAFIFPVVGP